MESIVEDVIKQQITGLNDIDLASRRAKEAATRRYEAAAWLRRTVGVVGAKDLAEEPSEEEFRIGIRNGIILCNAINKVLPGAIPKVVDVPVDSFSIPEGAPLSAYQYFENVRNFLVTLQSMGLPSFEASDLEKGGKSSRVVDSVLALKSYVECKQQGKNGSFKFGGITRPGSFSVSHFIRKNSYPFMNCTSRAQILSEKPIDELSLEDSLSGNFLIQSAEMSSSHSLNMLVRKALSNKKLEEVPLLVETMLHKVMQEFEQRIGNNNEMMDVHENDSKITEEESKVTEKAVDDLKENCLKQQLKESFQENYSPHQLRLKCIEEKENMERFSKQHAKELKHTLFKEKHIKQQIIFDRQQTEIQKLKCILQLTKSDMKDMKSHCLEEFENLGNQLHALANAASGYYKVLEENRKLYNQIQDLKGNIRVYCRVRPFLPGSKVSIIDFMDDQNITISSPLKASKDACRTFVFNKVFGPSASQEEVFSDTQPLIRSVLDGYNVCIFAYGQTGSGKTHTMNGPKELNEKSMGVNYRALNDLFYLSDMRKDTVHYEISVQMLEIYNEQVRDLLNDGLSKKLEIRNSSNKGHSVPDANLIPVRSTKEVIEIMSLGHKNRAVGYTALNDRSSRSHSCLTIYVQGTELTSCNTVRGRMHLVDLAGSERVDKSEVKGERLKEAQHINKSLSALGDVIASLAHKNAHIPYRNSKLTQLLQDSLGGQAKTLMFVHISPEADSLGETLSTLKFAERVATVELGAAKINKDNGEAKELKEQVAALRMELARKTTGKPLKPTVSSTELRMKQNSASASHLNDEDDEFSYPSSKRQPMEEVGNIEVRSESTRQKKSNYHAEELQLSMESPWPDSSLQLDEDYKEFTGSEGWVDKVVVNSMNRTNLEDEDANEQDLLRRFLNEMRVHPEQEVNSDLAGEKGGRELQTTRFDANSADIENNIRYSSEAEYLNLLNVPNILSAADASLSKLKRPQAKGTKGMDGRNSSHGHIPSSSGKLLNGSTPTLNRASRQLLSADGKRSNIKRNGKQ